MPPSSKKSLPVSSDYYGICRDAIVSHDIELFNASLPLPIDHYKNNSLLCLAAREGMKEIVEKLIPVSSPSTSHAVLYAARSGSFECVEILLPLSTSVEVGETLNLIVKNCRAIESTDGVNYEKCAHLLSSVASEEDNTQALISAVNQNDVDFVKLLLPKSNPKLKDSMALHCAVLYGHQPIIDLLVPVSDGDVVWELLKTNTQVDLTYFIECYERHLVLQSQAHLTKELEELSAVASEKTVALKRKI